MQIKDSSFNGQTPALLALIISFGLGVSSKVPNGGADLFFYSRDRNSVVRMPSHVPPSKTLHQDCDHCRHILSRS